MDVGVEPLERRPSRTGALDRLEREAFAIPFVAVYLFLLLRKLPALLTQDSWLTLLGGRQIWQHGLPSTESLTVVASGRDWIDQQWLAQAVTYPLFRAGGVELVLLVHVALLVGALALALGIARHRGASARRVGVVAALALLAVYPSGAFRAQTFAYPLFLGLLWLLIADARAPSRRVYLTLPILVVWANVHGSAVLGAGLVVLAGIALAATRLRARERFRLWWRHSALLVVAAPLCLFGSPYAASLPSYYRQTITNTAFGQFVPEWRAPTFTGAPVFFVLAFLAVWLIGRHGRVLTLFEKLALGATILSALLAGRNAAWFALAALVILPTAVQDAWPIRADEIRRRQLSLALAFSALGLAVLAVGSLSARPAGWFERAWPSARLADAVAAETAKDDSLRVFADTRYADWLLWKRPELAGRVAIDVRFELLSNAEMERIADYQSRYGAGWKAAAGGYRLLVVDRADGGGRAAELLAEPHARLLARDGDASAILRPRAS